MWQRNSALNLANSHYEVRLSTAARKQLHKFDRPVQKFLLDALSLLADNPRPVAAKSLVGRPGPLRIRVRYYSITNQVWRQDLTVSLSSLATRRDA